MNQPAKISSLSINSQGKPERKAKVGRDESELNAADKRWDAHKAEFRDKRWAECPPELSADFALAMARDLAREYGTGGAMNMAAMMTSGSAFDHFPNGLNLRLSARASGQGQARIDLVLQDEAPGEDSDVAVEIVGSVDPQDAQTLAPDALMKKMFERGDEERRTPFDPLAPGAMAATDVAALVADVEKKLAGAKDLDILCASAMVLLAWRQAESNNAEHVTLKMSGLTNGDQDVYPGRTLAMTAHVRMHDVELRKVHSSGDDMAQATITVTRNKSPKP